VACRLRFAAFLLFLSALSDGGRVCGCGKGPKDAGRVDRFGGRGPRFGALARAQNGFMLARDLNRPLKGSGSDEQIFQTEAMGSSS
jgi:hypothetical protein